MFSKPDTATEKLYFSAANPVTFHKVAVAWGGETSLQTG